MASFWRSRPLHLLFKGVLIHAVFDCRHDIGNPLIDVHKLFFGILLIINRFAVHLVLVLVDTLDQHRDDTRLLSVGPAEIPGLRLALNFSPSIFE